MDVPNTDIIDLFYYSEFESRVVLSPSHSHLGTSAER